MTVNIGAFEELEKAVLSADKQNLARIKRDLQSRLQDLDPLAVHREDVIWCYELYLDALCDMRLGACRWNSPVAGDLRFVALTAAELDFFAEWYDVVSAIARSINQRKNDGRGGCNTAKKEALLHFMGEHAEEVDCLVGTGKRYAVYLYEHTKQIMRMIDLNAFETVEKISMLTSEYL